MTFRPEKISAGFGVDEFVDIDAKVTNARVKVDCWGESTVYLQAELVRQGSRYIHSFNNQFNEALQG